MTSLTRRFSSLVSGKPPSTFLSHSTVAAAAAAEPWWIVTTKVPPVEGWSATSPMAMEKVDRSSWAYCFVSPFSYECAEVVKGRGEGGEEVYICCSEHPFALRAELDCDSREDGPQWLGVLRFFLLGHGGLRYVVSSVRTTCVVAFIIRYPSEVAITNRGCEV